MERIELFGNIELSNQEKMLLPIGYRRWFWHEGLSITEINVGVSVQFYNSRKIIPETFYKPISKPFHFEIKTQ